MKCLVDITTAITYISDITNTEITTTSTTRSSVVRQIAEEKQNPVIGKLKEEFKKYELVMALAIYEKTKAMINELGTQSEIDRFTEFIKTITIIEDVTEVDEDIQEGLKLSEYERALIYPAHKFGYHIITGNVTLIKKISNEYGSFTINAILHASRSLYGNKS